MHQESRTVTNEEHSNRQLKQTSDQSLHCYHHQCQFKPALVMFTIHTHRCPDYLGDSVQACNSDPARTRLRSASSSDYTVPRTRTKFVDRAFSVASPVVWNSLPAAVREADSLHSFRRKLKTHLFTLCFND